MSSRIMQFNSAQEELDYYRAHAEDLELTLQDTRAALDEFQVSSRELEEELEKELQATEKAYNDLKSRCEHFKRDAEDWKSKYTESKHEQNIAMVQMQREIDILRATEDSFRKKVLELELDNDDLERTERAATSSLTDLEMKLNKAIERNVILENEIQTKDNLTEQTQRLKDELNEVNQELSVLRSQSAKQSEYIGELENKIEDVEKKNRQQSQQMQQRQNRSPTPETAGNYYDPYSRTRSTRIPRTPTSGSLSSSSNPVKMVQEMVGRVRSLEARLQSCRSLVTPLLNPPPSYSSSNYTYNRDTHMSTSRPSSPDSMRSGSPMHFSNIKARRPSEYMKTSMDTSEE
ncbi:Glutaminyl-tRNA synthetase [Mucor velutinosus]|uniref:Glutaminyl-tRNA synthetase n=1 Tax=Mucor velutinosus TaxID=708070 RepID=A0AAN7DCJ9_9FUNG|nr:Glutaminyl-tRNA synthetase [Mucor velutinosus]